MGYCWLTKVKWRPCLKNEWFRTPTFVICYWHGLDLKESRSSCFFVQDNINLKCFTVFHARFNALERLTRSLWPGHKLQTGRFEQSIGPVVAGRLCELFGWVDNWQALYLGIRQKKRSGLEGVVRLVSCIEEWSICERLTSRVALPYNWLEEGALGAAMLTITINMSEIKTSRATGL